MHAHLSRTARTKSLFIPNRLIVFSQTPCYWVSHLCAIGYTFLTPLIFFWVKETFNYTGSPQKAFFQKCDLLIIFAKPLLGSIKICRVFADFQVFYYVLLSQAILCFLSFMCLFCTVWYNSWGYCIFWEFGPKNVDSQNMHTVGQNSQNMHKHSQKLNKQIIYSIIMAFFAC